MTKLKTAGVERRVLTTVETAAYLGRSTSWLTRHAARLYRTGFPRPIPHVGGYDKAAIDRWLDRLGSSPRPVDYDDAWIDAAVG
jgi:predicted DNA-binding transcriptional regulator AlpA